MFKGFSQDTFDFMSKIRENNNKIWFEENKKTYIDKVYHPMKELCAELYKPFSDIPAMMAKAGRIYRDEFFPPYLKYREDMWIVIRRNAWDWSKTPSLFFELSGDGVLFGFKIPKPPAGVMELFRQKLLASPEYFTSLVKILEDDFNAVIGGDEYKRPKPCGKVELERFFKLKGLTATVRITDKRVLFSGKLAQRVSETFEALFPLNEYFQELVTEYEASKAREALEAQMPEEQEITEMPKAPSSDFMW